MEKQHQYMMKMEIFYQVIRKTCYIVALLSFIACQDISTKKDNSKEDISFSKSQLVLEVSIDGIYKKYADSLSNIESTSQLPNFIHEYNSNLKSMESTAFHMSRSAVYDKILDLCDTTQLKSLITILEKKPDKNDNEDMVLKKAKFFVKIKPGNKMDNVLDSNGAN